MTWGNWDKTKRPPVPLGQTKRPPLETIMHYYQREIFYYFSKKHGFGICYDRNDSLGKVYYEDDTCLEEAGKAFDEQRRAINCLRECANDRWVRTTAAQKKQLDLILASGFCKFEPYGKERIKATVHEGKKDFVVTVKENKRAYYDHFEASCSCDKVSCMHAKAVGIFCNRQLRDLKHKYIVTEKPVNKTLFLEDSLVESINDGILRDYDTDSIEKIRAIIQKVDSAKSESYYWLFHSFLLSMDPYSYDAHFLENYDYLLLALFENENYQRVVISSGAYADPEEYEGRQHRSNRASFKRSLKEYQKVIKELDEKQDYCQDGFKDFLLKYRGDLRTLLKYYAFGKENLERCDLHYLDLIAGMQDIPSGEVRLTLEKMDDLADFDGAEKVFQKLMGHLSHEEMIEVYQSLRKFSMPLDKIRVLPPEEQEKLIYNLPVSKESFTYIMDELLPEKPAKMRGYYILNAVSKISYSEDREIRETILEKTAALPDNRLLLAYVWLRLTASYGGMGYRLGGKTKPLKTYKPNKGIPEKELETYFNCGYQVENKKSSFVVHFKVTDPVSDGFCLLWADEEGQTVSASRCIADELAKEYDAVTVRKVCLSGKEEAYEKAVEKHQDAVDTFLFEKKNGRFAQSYKKYCQSLQEEKIVFRPEEKAGIEWLLYREEGSNALAFKVGSTRKYVVKEASTFLQAFRSGQTIQYGRDLILTHDPENLEEQDGSAIRLLMGAKYSVGRKTDKKNKRYITVNDSLLENLLEHLSGKTVFYNDEPCLLRLQKQEIRIRVSKKYVLSTDLISEKQEFLNLCGKGFVVTHQDKGEPCVIDRTSGTAAENGLISLVDENPSVSVKPILKDFKKNVYSRYFDMFDVDKAIAEDFRLSEIRINTYFDYEKSVITYKTKITKDDKAVSSEGLTERADISKYELYMNYLTELGFDDGIMADEARILSFFKMDFTRLKSLTNVYLSESLKNKELRTVGKPVIRVTYKNDILSAFLEKSEYTEKELEQILRGIRRKKKFILLDGNRIVDLSSETARDFEETVSDLGLKPGELYEKKIISMITAIKAFAHEKSCRADRYLRDMIDEIRSFKEAEIPVPRLSGELRDYQKEGYNWLSILSGYGMGGILADDMGLGKTIQIIALIKANKTKKPSLVVCPKSLVFNWISEFARFDGETEVVEIYGPDSKRSERIAAIDYNKKAVYVTSYESLRNDIAKYSGEFNYGILDEAQYIKNVHALKTKSVKELKALHRFALTGTPIENSVVDLWSIFDYIMPGYFEELQKFRESDNADIARKAGPFILRRIKEDVLEDLPPKYERLLTADMSDGQRKAYDAFRLEARNILEEGGNAFDILPYLTRLRQICVDPGMFIEDYSAGSGKMELLNTLIPEYLENGHRILIFSQFVKALESVRSLLKTLSIPSYFLSGATPAKERVEMMDLFNNGSGTDVFLVSLKAGGTGLNLTGADTVIHLDPWWNVAAENQASDRTHRIGQKRNVEVIKLIAEDSIEQRVVELQDIKKEVINQVISDDDGSVTSASLEDIAFVLG